jgi:hypothetical protein
VSSVKKDATLLVTSGDCWPQIFTFKYGIRLPVD